MAFVHFCLFVCMYVWNLYKFTFLNWSEPNFAHVFPSVTALYTANKFCHLLRLHPSFQQHISVAEWLHWLANPDSHVRVCVASTHQHPQMNSMHASKHPTFGNMWKNSHWQQTWGFTWLEMHQLEYPPNSSWYWVMERHLNTQTQDVTNSHATFATLSALLMNWRQTCSRTSTTITDDMSDSVKGLSWPRKMIVSIHWTYRFKTCCQQTAEHTSLLTSSWILHRLCSIQWSFLTLRRLMSYIYGAPILDVSRSHTTTQHSR